jgi:hypothetical protein
MTTLDDQLRAFLKDQAEEKGRGITNAAIYDAQKRLADAHAAHEQKCDLRWERNAEHHASTEARLRTLEARMEDMRDKAEDTGRHNIEALTLAAEAKGIAQARVIPKDSLPPLTRALAKAANGLATKLAERWTLHLVLLVVGLLLGWLGHGSKIIP